MNLTKFEMNEEVSKSIIHVSSLTKKNWLHNYNSFVYRKECDVVGFNEIEVSCDLKLNNLNNKPIVIEDGGHELHTYTREIYDNKKPIFFYDIKTKILSLERTNDENLELKPVSSVIRFDNDEYLSMKTNIHAAKIKIGDYKIKIKYSMEHDKIYTPKPSNFNEYMTKKKVVTCWFLNINFDSKTFVVRVAYDALTSIFNVECEEDIVLSDFKEIVDSLKIYYSYQHCIQNVIFPIIPIIENLEVFQNSIDYSLLNETQKEIIKKLSIAKKPIESEINSNANILMNMLNLKLFSQNKIEYEKCVNGIKTIDILVKEFFPEPKKVCFKINDEYIEDDSFEMYDENEHLDNDLDEIFNLNEAIDVGEDCKNDQEPDNQNNQELDIKNNQEPDNQEPKDDKIDQNDEVDETDHDYCDKPKKIKISVENH